MAELSPNEMRAIQIMASGSELPDTITKSDLANIITILCVKLKWIEQSEDHYNQNIVESVDTNGGVKYEHNIGFPESKDMQGSTYVPKNTETLSAILVSNSEVKIEIEDHFSIEDTEWLLWIERDNKITAILPAW